MAGVPALGLGWLVGDFGRHDEGGGVAVLGFGGVDHWFGWCAVVGEGGGVVFAIQLCQLG